MPCPALPCPALPSPPLLCSAVPCRAVPCRAVPCCNALTLKYHPEADSRCTFAFQRASKPVKSMKTIERLRHGELSNRQIAVEDSTLEAFVRWNKPVTLHIPQVGCFAAHPACFPPLLARGLFFEVYSVSGFGKLNKEAEATPMKWTAICLHYSRRRPTYTALVPQR